MTDQSRITVLFTGAPASADKFTPGISTVALVRLPGKLVLFDTGPYAYRPILLGRLKKLGVELGDIDAVVLSHCHWDAASNADLFPKADVILHERELAYAQGVSSHDDQTQGYIGRALRKLRLQTISGDMDLGREARILDLPGHTPGSIGLLVGEELLAGDAVACARDVARGAPTFRPFDVSQAKSSLDRAVASAKLIYPGHDRQLRIEDGKLGGLADYSLRIRLFTDPGGPDEEIQIGSHAPKSFASWP